MLLTEGVIRTCVSLKVLYLIIIVWVLNYVYINPFIDRLVALHRLPVSTQLVVVQAFKFRPYRTFKTPLSLGLVFKI
jgi:hypothetical protein